MTRVERHESYKYVHLIIVGARSKVMITIYACSLIDSTKFTYYCTLSYLRLFNNR